jgi:diguanylate cyclase (GGDEF)-like protein
VTDVPHEESRDGKERHVVKQAESAGVVDTAIGLATVLEATRALLWVETPVEAATVTRTLVERLGGELVAPSAADPACLTIDVSFGVGRPRVPSATPGTPARERLDQVLPTFIRDTDRALELVDRTRRLAEEAAIDPLTGIANRRMLGRVLGRLRPDDTVVLIDLDHFKTVNDTLGHEEGDRVLKALGRALGDVARASDRVGRYGGEEFVVVLAGGDAEPFLRRFHNEWLRRRPHAVTFSAGVAPAAPGTAKALKAADRAMYRAKLHGRDQWQWATEEDYR